MAILALAAVIAMTPTVRERDKLEEVKAAR